MSSYVWPPNGTNGTVTSIGLSDSDSPTIFTIGNSPVTTNGTITIALSNQAANLVLAGPGTGSPAQPTFRSLVAADVPTLPYISTTLGTANGLSVATNTLSLALSSTSTTGALSSTDWNTFNNKQATITKGNLTEATSAVLSITGGTNAVIGTGTTIQVAQSSGSVSGYLSSTDWTTFNGKQASGNYITALTGDGTASGPGSVGLTFATVNANVGSFGSSTAIPTFTVTGKGLVTAASTSAVVAPASTLTGNTLASGVVTSSLTTVGTIATGVWNGTAVDVAHGGTGIASGTSGGIPYYSGTTTIASSGALTAHAVVVGGGAGTTPATVATGSSGNLLMSNGSGSNPTMTDIRGNSTALKAPTVTVLNSTGTTTGYLFTISTSTTCAAGDTYTNNGNTYTVLGALTAQTGAVLFVSGASAPTAPGTALVRSSGAGTSSISFTASAALATYTAPTSPSPLYLKIRLIGGGGGGGGQGSGANPGGAGSYSTFGANLLLGNGGSGGGAASNYGGAGGTATVTAPAVGIAVSGAYGASAGNHASLAANLPGGAGGSSPFGGAGGGGGPAGNAALNAASNSGSGGAGPESATSANTGSGGGAGGYVDVVVPSPSATYPYIIGSGGTAGNSGTGNGGTGAAGVIFIEEYYQ